MPNRPTVAILDRDGTVIVDKDYLADPEGVELLPGSAEGLRRLRALGLRLVIVTNQSGVGRGYFSADAMHAVNDRVREILAASGAPVEGIYACPHGPDENCACRKPQPGLIEQAAADLGFDPAECVVIGDKAADIELGKALGAMTVLVRTGYGAQTEADASACPDYVADTLLDAADFIARSTDPVV